MKKGARKMKKTNRKPKNWIQTRLGKRINLASKARLTDKEWAEAKALLFGRSK